MVEGSTHVPDGQPGGSVVGGGSSTVVDGIAGVVVVGAIVVAGAIVVVGAMVVAGAVVVADPVDSDEIAPVVATSAPCSGSVVDVAVTDVVDDSVNRSPTVSPGGLPQATRRTRRVMGATAQRAGAVRRRPTFRRPARPRR